LGRLFGLRVHFFNVSFDQLITGIVAGRYDMAMSSLTDTKARQQAVDMVTYFDAGNSFVVLTSSPLRISGFAGLCGHTVAIEAGSTYVQQVAAEQPQCAAAHKPPIHAQAYANQADANLALLSARAQVTMEDSPVAAYQARQDHRFLVTGRIFGTAPYGIAVTKNSGLARAVRDALRVLIANGTYHSITSKWGISSGDISNPVINGATS
ncbi:MAG: ABC transporter substrate-binding protein, partial [Gemmataceae bacterium]